MTSTDHLFPVADMPVVPVVGETRVYPVRRILCVGRNYADHAKEMGFEVDREAPWYFAKDPATLVLSGATIPYPPETANFHYEMELVVALGRPAFRIPVAEAAHAVFGYATGLDMTRRDLQIAYREKSRPWCLGKNFERSAVVSPITPSKGFPDLGPQRITLRVGNTVKQDATLADMVWSVAEIISHLSRFYRLGPGDLIYTGTPAGVGPVGPGDTIVGEIDGLQPVTLTIAAAGDERM